MRGGWVSSSVGGVRVGVGWGRVSDVCGGGCNGGGWGGGSLGLVSPGCTCV